MAEKNVNVSFPDFALLSGGLRGAFPWLTIERHHEKILKYMYHICGKSVRIVQEKSTDYGKTGLWDA
jgi:hypothetical protein